MASTLRRTFSTFRKLFTMEASDLTDFSIPPVVRGMKELDRSIFRKVIPTTAVTVSNPRLITKVRTALTRSKELLYLKGLKLVVDDESTPGAKRIVLNPMVQADRPASWSAQLTALVDDGTVQVRPHDLELTYDNWTMHNIFEAVLPDLPDDQKETPAGFAQVGHIAHVNLRAQYLPWKYVIGQVMVDKNPTVRTVINKTLDVGSESEFRTFPYEILAGDPDLNVTQIEQGCEFRFNFADVYWNTRLASEHERVVAKFQPGQAVCDVMAGVGPFAVPAGAKRVFVMANDLNPSSFVGLQWAINRNKVSDFVSAFCMDGRAFIRESAQKLASHPRRVEQYPRIRFPRGASPAHLEELERMKAKAMIRHKEPRAFDHYVMNLPASAVEFLDAFRGLFQGREIKFRPHTPRKLPMIHVYTFQPKLDTAEEEVKQVCEKVSKHLGAEVKPTDDDVEIHDIRLVSPKKKYYRASFRLPAEIAFASDSL